MSKLNNIDYIDNRNGENIPKEIFNSISREDRIKEIKKVYYILDNTPEKLTLEDLELLMKLGSRNTNKIKLDFKDDGYFTCKRNHDTALKLNDYTKSLLYSITHMITHDGRLTYGNNKIVSSITDLKKYLKVSNDKWNIHIKPDIEKYNIIKKEKIDNKWCLLLNPLYATTTRVVTETLFIAFHKELKQNLHNLDYLYLKRFHGIEL